MAAHTQRRRGASQKGQELIEFTLMLFLYFGIVFMVLDVAWMVFTRATLQYAVREGVRWGITNGSEGDAAEASAIQAKVQANAMGFLNGQANLITVCWKDPQNLANGCLSTGGSAPANASGYVLEVSVPTYSQTSLYGVFTYAFLHKFTFGAASADLME